MLERYRTVLALPGGLRLYLTGVLARLPQGMSSLTILLLVRGATHSYALAGLAVGCAAVAAAAAGPPQGRLVDRLGRARVLGPCAVVQAALFVGLVLAVRRGAPGGGLVLLACAIGASEPAVAPSVRALLTAAVHDETVRESAYALEAVFQELVWIVGPLLTAVAVAAASPSAAAILCAVLVLVGTGLFVVSPMARGEIRPAGLAPRAVLRGAPALRGLLVPVALMGAALGATEVGLPALALHAGSRASTGLLLAVWAAGSMVGGLVYGSRAWSLPLVERYRRLLAGAVLGAAPLVLARSIPAGLVGAVLAGLAIAPVFSCQYALVGRAIPAGAETEAFTWVSGALVVGLAGGSALGGVLVGGFGCGGPFLLACLALAVAAATSVRARRVAVPA